MTILDSLSWLAEPPALPDADTCRKAERRQASLTKPPGALGRLEDAAVRLAALQRTETPRADRVRIVVFAADHGVAAEGVSAFPQAVTGEMVRNFGRGGAAICVAARHLGASLGVVNLGTAVDTDPLPGVTDLHLGPGTENMTRGPAMSHRQLAHALAAGREAVEAAAGEHFDLFIGGEMGIANTTAASAMACALLDLPPESTVGPGTGLAPKGVQDKITVVRQALARHADHGGEPAEILRRLGGFEIAALAGSYVACAQLGLPALVDGFISSVAALTAVRLRPGAEPWLLFSHASAEPGHRAVLEALHAQPLLDLDMRLGEGSGAAVAVPLLRMACALHNEMATFTQADVSEQQA